MGYTVAVVGATGAVGAQMIKMLEESTLPIDNIRYLASARSAGKVLQFKGQDVTIEETTEDAFEGVDIALFSAGGSTSPFTTLATEPRCESQICCAFFISPSAKAALMLATNFTNAPLPKITRKSRSRYWQTRRARSTWKDSTC